MDSLGKKASKGPLWRRILRSLLVGLGATLTVVAALAVGVALFVAHPPADLMRRAALPLVEQILGHSVELGAFELDLGRKGHLELRDLSIPPLSGYALPLFTLARVTVDYDARAAQDGRIVIERVEVERPNLFVEERGGKLNWIAFLERLAKGGAEEETTTSEERTSVPEEKASAGAPFELVLKRLAISGVALYADMDGRRALLDGLDVHAAGRVRGDEADLELRVSLARKNPKGASLAVTLRDPRPLEAYLDTRVDLRTRVTHLRPLVASMTLAVDVNAQRLVSEYALPAMRLALRMKGGLDQKEDRARLERLELSLDGEQIIDLGADITALSKSKQLDARLAALSLPLGHLARYARAVVPGLDIGGAIRVRDLRVRGGIDELGEGLPPLLGGEITLDKLRARVQLPLVVNTTPAKKASAGPRQEVELKELSGRIRFAAARGVAASDADSRALLAALPEPAANAVMPKAAAGVQSLVDLRLRGLRAFGASIGGVDVGVGVAAKLRGLAPQDVALRARVAVSKARYQHPKLGRLGASTTLAVDAHVNVPSRAATLERLRLDVDRLLKLKVEARAKDYQAGPFEARVQIAPLPLARLLARVPAPIRRGLPLERLSGRLGLKLDVAGRPPPPRASPLALPLRYDLRVSMKGIGARLRGKGKVAGPRVEGLDGMLRVSGRRGKIKLRGNLALARAREPAQGIMARGLSLKKLEANISPQRVDAAIELGLKRLRQDTLGMRLDQRGVELSWSARAALGGRGLKALLAKRSSRLGAVSVALGVGFDKLAATMAGVDARVSRARLSLAVEKSASARAPLGVKIRVGVGSLSERVQKAKIKGMSLDIDAKLTRGLALTLPAVVFDLGEAAGRAGIELSVAEVRHPSLPKALRSTTLGLDVGWPLRGPLALERLALRVPTFGASVDGSGSVRLSRADLMAPQQLLARGIPEMRWKIGAAVRTPKGGRGRLDVLPGIALWGGAGVDVALSTLDSARLKIDGRVWAKKLTLRQSSERTVTSEQHKRRFERTLEVRRLEANIPLRQRLTLKLQPFELTIPPPKRSIFDSAAVGVAYRTMRPFLGRGANLALDGVRVVDRLTETSASGKARRSESTLAVGRTLLDLNIADSTISLDRLYVSLFGGDIFGAVQVQVPSTKPFDARLRVDTRLTNVDFAYLDAKARGRKESAKVSALARLKTHWSERDVSGRVVLTDLTLKTLDGLLAFLDPHGLNPSLKANRALINSWIIKKIDPEVRQVSVWIDHSRLNLDVGLDAGWGLGFLLRQALSQMRIRRVSIKPFLPKVKKKKRKGKGDESRKRRPAARRGRGRLRVR